MQKEEKQLEQSLEGLIQRVQELKNAIQMFLFKLEHEYETLNWPSVLDNFALLSGQLNSLGRLLKNDKVPALRNHVFLPLVLSPDRDAELEKLTERRVMMFNHAVVPDYLRTKPEPEVDEKISQLTSKAGTVVQETAQKQFNNLNKITSNLLDIINSAKEEWESESNQKSSQPVTFSSTDTNNLVSTILFGKSIKVARKPDSSNTQPQGMPNPQQQQKVQSATVSKAPSAIKTQIKAASSSHPYQRP
ncbi:hypothetical protein CHS0354_021781 [Potamilus streckersoni]|uniref:Mediator of RNA polymerase II transcription subunit 8 n=2 Tax=Potamilus streckersoni TaxID=2493646 RepID=A0AAE0VNN3_9BIVA|nr:hypothetical protein CHS0354_021781 [Potamilus streckersoni]